MTAITRLQKTGWYVTAADGRSYHDDEGHGYFSKTLARDIARRLGGWYDKGTATTVKEVVQGYITADSPAVLDADAERLAREERWT